MRALAVIVGFCGVDAFRSRKPTETDCYSLFDGKPLIQLQSDKSNRQDMMDLIIKSGCTDMSESRGSDTLMAICDRVHVKKLTDVFGDSVSVLQKDAGAFYRDTGGSPRIMTRNSDFFSDWRGYEDKLDFVTDSVQNSGGVATLEEVGKSFEGRPIMAVRITGSGYTAGKNKMVISCQLHAREWVAGMTCVYAVQEFISKAKADPTWLIDTEVVIIPMANPDGILFSETGNRFWRKNRKANSSWSGCVGVDLNRNWGVDWAGPHSVSSNPCSDVFYGPGAFSEPETQAVKKVIDEAPITVHLDVHAYSELILAPWSFQVAPHPRRAEIDVLGNAMQTAVANVNGHLYTYGGSEVLYPASGVAPDYGTSAGGFGFTYEARPATNWGGGFAPPASEIMPTATECLAGFITAVTFMQGGELPTAAPTPAPLTCPTWSSYTTPDSDGDCKCPYGQKCSRDGGSTQNCPCSGGVGGWGGSYFFPTCDDCQCY